MQKIFDGHNDVLQKLWEEWIDKSINPVNSFRSGRLCGHVDALLAKKGAMAGGLCSIYVPDILPLSIEDDGEGPYETPLSPCLDSQYALNVALAQFGIATRLDRAGAWRLCKSVDDISMAVSDDIFAAVLHMEGCEPIDKDLNNLEVFYAAGLRSLGPVWSRNNIFGHGVPFALRSPDTGSGLSDLGFELIRRCDQLGIIIDLSHITEAGFKDVERCSSSPLVASHSNAYSLSPVARNLTDRQLDAIKERKGLVGFCFALRMLQSSGRNWDLSVCEMLPHLDYLINRVGIDCIAIGSDFDGATLSSEIADASGLQKLLSALTKKGWYSSSDIAKICRENWIRIFKSVWKK